MMAYGHIDACGAEKCVYLWGAGALSISILDFLRQSGTINIGTEGKKSYNYYVINIQTTSLLEK